MTVFRSQLPSSICLAAVAGVLSACTFDASGINNADALPGTADGSPLPDSPPGTPDARPDAMVDARIDINGEIVSFTTSASIVIDGNSNDWGDAVWYDFASADADQKRNCSGYDDSSSARFASLHDGTYIYFFFEVTDDVLFGDDGGGADLWRDDGINLYINATGGRNGAYANGDNDIFLSYNDDSAIYYGTAMGSTITVVTTAGYNVEVRLEKSSLGINTLPSSMGFDFEIMDDDNVSGDYIDCIAVWHIQDVLHCSNCCSNNTPRPTCDTTTHGLVHLQ